MHSKACSDCIFSFCLKPYRTLALHLWNRRNFWPSRGANSSVVTTNVRRPIKNRVLFWNAETSTFPAGGRLSAKNGVLFLLSRGINLFLNTTNGRFHHKIGKLFSFCQGFPYLMVEATLQLCVLLPRQLPVGFKGGAPKAFGAHNRLLRSTTLICSGFCSNRSVKTSGFFWRQSFFR